MAYVVATKGGAFEARESRNTPAGPRSRTLATFGELDAATIEKVIERAVRAPSREDLIEAALRAGATVATTPADGAARDLLRSIARGEQPNPKLRRLLLDALSGESRSPAEWLGASMTDRGDALRDLLLLTDALPIRRRAREVGFPKIDSTR